MAVTAEFKIDSSKAVEALELVVSKFNMIEGVGSRMELALKANFTAISRHVMGVRGDIDGVGKELTSLVRDSERAEKSMKNAFDGAAKSATRANRAIEKAGQATAKAGRESAGVNRGGMFSAMRSSPLVGQAMTLGSAALVGGGIMGIKANADREMYQQRFTTMLGDKEGSQAYDFLKSYGDKTPYELNELASSMSVIVGATGDLQKSMVTIQRLGDIAAVAGGDIQLMSAAYGKAANIGLDMELVNQFAEKSIDVLGYLADRDGLSKDEVRKGIEKKQYGVEDVDALLLSMTSEGGRFFQGAQRQSETFWGRLSTFMDTLNNKLANAVEPIMGKIIDGMEVFFTMLDKAMPVIQSVGGSFYELFESISPLAMTMAETMGGLAIIFASLVSGAAALISALSPIAEHYAEVTAAAVGFLALGIVDFFKDLGDALAWLESKIAAFVPSITAAADKLKPVTYDIEGYQGDETVKDMQDMRNRRQSRDDSNLNFLAEIESASKERIKAAQKEKAIVKKASTEAQRQYDAYQKESQRQYAIWRDVQDKNRDYTARTTLSEQDYQLYQANERVKARTAELVDGGFSQEGARQQAMAEVSREGFIDAPELIGGNNRANAIRGLGSELGRSSVRLLGGTVDDVQKRQLTQQEKIAQNTQRTFEALKNFQQTAPVGLL